jgi:hypothetical protein
MSLYLFSIAPWLVNLWNSWVPFVPVGNEALLITRTIRGKGWRGWEDIGEEHTYKLQIQE